MKDHITIRATVAAWVSPGYGLRHLTTALERNDSVEALGSCSFYGSPDRAEFCDNVRIGEADITLRLLPKDERVRQAVASLQKMLDEERAKWLTRQQEILAEINKLQALEFDGGEA